MIKSAKRLGLALRILCAVSLLVFGFAHRSAASDATEVALYTLPDGSVPSICLASDTDHNHPLYGGACEACRLAAAILLPTPCGDATPPLLREVATLGPAVAPPEVRRPLQHHAAPRAPPASPAA